MAEGNNLYFTNNRANSFIDASSTIPKDYTANSFTGLATFTGGVKLDALNGPLQSNNGTVSATTSIGVMYGGTGAISFSPGWIFSPGDGNALRASTSPTINYIIATSTTATSTFSTGGLAVGTTNFVVQQTSGNVGIGTSSPTRVLDVTGDWGGNVVVDSQLRTTSATITESTKALVYHLSVCNVSVTCATGNGTQGSAPTVTFNITGLSNKEGAFAFIETQVQRIGVSGGPSENSTITVQINGTQISTNTTGAGNNDSAVLIENYTVVRSNGSWKVIGAPGTSDTADLAEWFPYTGDLPTEGDVLRIGDKSESVALSGGLMIQPS